MFTKTQPTFNLGTCWAFVASSLLLIQTSGCVGVCVPSARFTESEPTAAIPDVSMRNVDQPGLQQGSQGAIGDPGDDLQSGFITTFPEGQCPPLVVFPALPRLRCLLWPFCRKQEESLLDGEMRAPLSRFYPVPTHPVFEPPGEYAEPLVAPESHRQHLIPPHLLPHSGSVQTDTLAVPFASTHG